MEKIRVLIVDDSALVRQVLSGLLGACPDIEVIGTAADPVVAIKKIKEDKPDVITLDLEMPRMDGLTFLEKLMQSFPLPVVVISSLALAGSATTLRALELGAIDFVTKPSIGIGQGLEDLGIDIIEKIKVAAQSNRSLLMRHAKLTRLSRFEKTAKSVVGREQTSRPLVRTTDRIVVIGASTGGTVAVRKVLQALPYDAPGIIVVLHMPPGFTHSYAQGLSEVCRLKVSEAQDGDVVMSGRVFVAPGGKHLLIEKTGQGYVLRLDESPLFNRHRPSVDKTFFSLAEVGSSNCMGVILTGMGDDGANGMRALRDTGAFTVAQDEKTCIVFGMPRQAIALGGVCEVLPIDEVAKAIERFRRGTV